MRIGFAFRECTELFGIDSGRGIPSVARSVAITHLADDGVNGALIGQRTITLVEATATSTVLSYLET